MSTTSPQTLPDDSILVNGATLTMLPQRALLWHRHRMLIIADIHIGKAAAFRAGGIPVPHGTTRTNLEAIDALLKTYAIECILFLGDFLHARAARAPATLMVLQQWRDRHPTLHLILVRGNHDHHAGDPPAAMRMEVRDEPLIIDGLAFCHHPQPIDDAYVLAGHLHPVLRLRRGRESVRLPCFVFTDRVATLPAFGAFTGGFEVDSHIGAHFFVCAGDDVFLIPPRRQGQPDSG